MHREMKRAEKVLKLHLERGKYRPNETKRLAQDRIGWRNGMNTRPIRI